MEELAPKIECEVVTEKYGRFLVQPLESGFGTTLGNALRRVLLGALPGIAVTVVKIEGVEHEFSTIPHIKEDTIDFLLNVKGLRLRPLSEESGRLRLEIKGEGNVSAADIQLPPHFEIVNPEHHLATLDSPDAKLSAEFYVEHGKGYVPAGQGSDLPLPIGAIPVDAIFAPVQRVNYKVEKIRIGRITSQDRLILEIWTDGTLTAIEALNRSAQILIGCFSPFAEVGKGALPAPGKQPFFAAVPPEKYDIPVEDLGFSGRTLNCLRRAKIAKFGELLEKSKEDLLAIRSFGQKSLEEILSRLKSLDLIAPGLVEEEKTESLADEEEPKEAAETGEETADESEER